MSFGRIMKLHPFNELPMIDLHCHSIFSDGTESPEKLARMADKMGLSALALTDHDNLAGLPRFLAMQQEVSTRLISGIELSCRFMKLELHVIGLLFDHEDSALQAHIREVRMRRMERNDALIVKLQALGIQITLEDVERLAPTELVSRTHFARALHQMKVVSEPSEAYRRLIGEGCPAYVPFQELSPQDAAKWIHEAGGIAIVAHPGRFNGGGFIWDIAMRDLRDAGLDGFEAYYGEYGEKQERYFLELAKQLGMIPSGGSDYHGHIKPHLQMGKGRGRLRVPKEVLERMDALQTVGMKGAPR